MSDSDHLPTRRALLKSGLACVVAAGAPLRAQSDAMSRGSERPSQSAAAATGDAVSQITLTLSDYIATASERALPAPISEATKQHFLDTLAAMISGSRLVPGKSALAYVQALGGTAEACVPGSGIVTNVINAALAGGMLAHADETDDTHAPSIVHPGCSTVPAALAMAERHRSDGTALLRAIALGYDVSTRVAMACNAYAFSPAGHSNSAFGGTFGAAAACASVARMTADQVRHVLSFASQQAGGLSNFARDKEHVEKSFVFGGLPARNGATAATMVEAGMSGIDDAFAGDRNFFFAYAPTAKPQELVRGLGDRFEIVNTTIKRWSVGAPIQAPLDSLSYLIKTNKLTADDVVSLTVRVSHQGVHTSDNSAVPDINMQYMLSAMLLDGIVTMDAAHDAARMNDPKIRDVRRRIVLVADDDLDRALPSQQGIVEVTLRDGRTLRHHTTDVRGTPANPMSRDEVEEKCAGLLGPVLGKERARRLIDAAWGLEAVRDVRTLRPLLVA
jgi:2-methylcitrate dehydratase PrpD